MSTASEWLWNKGDLVMQIYDTKVNHLTNPLGFRMDRTVFSWKVKDAKGTRQNAARIRIASDTAMQEILYDSGWEKEADSRSFPGKSDLPLSGIYEEHPRLFFDRHIL